MHIKRTLKQQLGRGTLWGTFAGLLVAGALQACTVGPGFSAHFGREPRIEALAAPTPEPTATPTIAEQTDVAETQADSGPALAAPQVLKSDDPRMEMARKCGVTKTLVGNDGATPQYSAQTGNASYYKDHQRTASGKGYDPEAFTAAHKTLPIGTLVKCTRVDSGESVVVAINDRGPFAKGRIIDLSLAAARTLKMTTDGVVPCKLEILAFPQDDGKGEAKAK